MGKKPLSKKKVTALKEVANERVTKGEIKEVLKEKTSYSIGEPVHKDDSLFVLGVVQRINSIYGDMIRCKSPLYIECTAKGNIVRLKEEFFNS